MIGSGAWGTALALNVHMAGCEVKIYSRNRKVADDLSAGRGNPTYLKDVKLPPMSASTDMADLGDCDAILAVTPAQFMRESLVAFAPFAKAEIPVALCSKGIERSSLKMMTEVLQEVLPGAKPAVLSGPSFAKDVARELPTAVTLASAEADIGAAWVSAIGRPQFRPYLANDLIGAEVGGAVKNVLAIACGAVEGLRLGKSAHAALIARGFAEMTRLGVAMGAKPETLSGLCGLGDLVLTCSSTQSRNMSFGFALGEGRAAADVLSERAAVTEGVATAPALVELARRYEVSMPICEGVAAVLDQKVTLTEAVTQILNRPFKQEY